MGLSVDDAAITKFIENQQLQIFFIKFWKLFLKLQYHNSQLNQDKYLDVTQVPLHTHIYLVLFRIMRDRLRDILRTSLRKKQKLMVTQGQGSRQKGDQHELETLNELESGGREDQVSSIHIKLSLQEDLERRRDSRAKLKNSQLQSRTHSLRNLNQSPNFPSKRMSEIHMHSESQQALGKESSNKDHTRSLMQNLETETPHRDDGGPTRDSKELNGQVSSKSSSHQGKCATEPPEDQSGQNTVRTATVLTSLSKTVTYEAFCFDLMSLIGLQTLL